MKKIGHALAAVGRTLFCEPLAIRIAALVVLLFAAIPTIHAVIAPYIKLLLLWGAVVGAADLFSRRRFLRNRYAVFLLLFAAAYAVSILLNRAAGLAGNLADLAYMLLFFCVLFPYDPAAPAEKAEREVRVLAWVFVLITFLFTVACLVTFLLNIRYRYTLQISDEFVTDVIFGISENRLHGIYNCNTGSALNVISIACSVLLLRVTGRRGGRVYCWVNIALQYICLVLTLSRTAWYAFALFTALAVFFVCPAFRLRRQWLADGLKALVAVVAAVAVLALGGPVKAVMAYAPGVTATVIRSVQKGDLLVGIPAAAEGAEADAAAVTDTAADAAEAVEKLDLTRVEDISEVGLLTGRTGLWNGGWHAFLSAPFFGTTREGMYAVAKPYVPSWLHLNLVRGGLHNMPVMVLACSGGVGFLLMAAFLLLSACRALRWMWRRRGTAEGATLNFLGVLLVTILCMEMMEARLLYTTTVFGAAFWTFYGYAAHLTDVCEPEKAARTGVWGRIARQRGEKHR